MKLGILLALLFSYAAVAGFFPVNRGMVNQETTVTTAAGTTSFPATGNQVYIFEGTTTQTAQFPNATSLPLDWWYELVNNSTGAVTVNDGSGASLKVLSAGEASKFQMSARATSAGTWKLWPSLATSNVFQKSNFISATTGVPDAGKPIKTNSSGILDVSFLPSLGSPLTTKGDLFGFSTVGARIPVGADTFVLTADSSQPLGLKWATAAASGMTQLTGDVTAGPGAGSQVASITNLALTKLAPLSTSVVPVTDGSGFLTSSAVTATTLGFLDATSSIQTQLNGKQASGSYITALTGDVTASGPGSASSTIANLAVTNAKIANSTIDLTAKVTSTLPLANGGTNSATAASAGSVVYSTASAMAYNAVGTTGQALISGNTGAPTWFAPTAGSVLFAGTSGILSQDNTGLFYSSANHQLGIGVTATSSSLEVSNGTAQASTPTIKIVGSPYTAGSATTNKPEFLMENAATSTAWSTAGSFLGINSIPSFTGNFIDVKLNNTPMFLVNSSGSIGIGTSSPANPTMPGITLKASPGNAAILTETSTASGSTIFQTGNNGNMLIQNNSKNLMQSDGSGHISLANGAANGAANLDTVDIVNQSGELTHNILALTEIASQTGDLISMYGSAGGPTKLAKFDSAGKGWFASAALGTSGSIAGILTQNGATTGSVVIQSAATAGNWVWTWPSSGGTNLYYLRTDGNGVTSWNPPNFSELSGAATVTQSTIATQVLSTCTTARTVDWSTGNSFTVTLTSGNACAFTFSNPTSGQTIVMWITNGGGGGTATATWSSSPKWSGGTTPTISTGTSALDVCTFTYNGSSYAGSCVQNLQ